MNHRCAQVENTGDGGSSDFCQNPWWGQVSRFPGFRTKLQERSTILGYIAFLLTSFGKFARGAGGDAMLYPSL